MKYSARITERIDQPGNGWGLRIGVFRAEEQIGEYKRNYQTLFETFCPFRIADSEYALFSPMYHVTRVMELPSCQDIGGEDPRGEGFCPTDYYVPSYIDTEHSGTLTPRLYYPFGFVAGCYWGDDSSWKIQYLDLSDAGKGIVRRDDRFGYIELPEKMRLRDAIDMGDYQYDGECSEIRIAVLKTFDLHTGKDLPPR